MLGKQSLPSPATKEEYVYDVLRIAILNCELRPGTRLVMDRLSEELGTSPIPIRSALQRLQSEGLVEIIPHTGAAVADLSPGAITELFTLAAALESIVMRVLAPSITLSGLEQLQQLVTSLDDVITGAEDNNWTSWDLAFHSMLANMTGMTLLAEFATRTHTAWYRLYNCYFNQAGPLRMEVAQVEHKRMLSLLADRNGPVLEALVVDHHRSTLQAYQAAYGPIIFERNLGE